ncbi:MAG: hypothetical protein GY694_00665 [Gammaproteobacteria bacterium]|nr:hypothetical protein [Gammaproteobacteria bacterium]
MSYSISRNVFPSDTDEVMDNSTVADKAIDDVINNRNSPYNAQINSSKPVSNLYSLTPNRHASESSFIKKDSEEESLEKSFLENKINQLTLDAVKLEARVSILAPEQVEIQQITTELLEKTHHLINQSGVSLDKLSQLEIVLYEVSLLFNTLDEQQHKQGIKNTHFEKITQKLSTLNKKIGQQVILHQHKIKSLEQRAHFIESKTLEISDESKKITLFFSFVLIVLIIGGLGLSVTGIDKANDHWLSAQNAIKNIASQLNTQGKQLLQKQTGLNDLNQQLITLQQQMLKGESVSESLKQEYEEVSSEIQSLTDKLSTIEEKTLKSTRKTMDETLYEKKEGVNSTQIEVHDSSWILQQNPEHYTIQLIGVRYKKSVFTYIRQNQALFNHSVAFIKTKYKGDDWFTLQYGQYKTFKEAQTALSKLPKEISTNRPWVRSNKRLHQL